MIKRSYLITRVMGIPIRVHITLVILLIFAALALGLIGILYAAGLFLSVAVHELGHSWVAIRKGCRVHEIMLLPIGGVAKMSGLPSRPKDEFLIAGAGPLTSLLLALFFWALALLGPFMMLFTSLAEINLMLCLFNLLPSFPMDGGRIFRAFMTPRIGRLKATALAVKIGRIMAIAFGIFGLFSGNWMLVLIAVFIYNAAGAEYRAVVAQQMQQEWFTVEPQADIYVSPPPYARTPKSFWKNAKEKTNAFFNDLFKNWQE
ncbi:MAG: site-2 protease family protein [Kiritimatiellales bacterium]